MFEVFANVWVNFTSAITLDQGVLFGGLKRLRRGWAWKPALMGDIQGSGFLEDIDIGLSQGVYELPGLTG